MQTLLRNIILCLSHILVTCIPLCAQLQKFSLNSDHIRWELKPQADLPVSGNELSKPNFKIKQSVQAVVPGTVFTSYVDAGIIPDPNYSDNIYKVDEAQFNRPFWYRTTFKTPSNWKQGQRIWLHFDNTNRYAEFYFNGVKLSGTATSTKDVSGHMLRSKFDVTDLLKIEKDNALAVLIYDADQKKSRDTKDQFGVVASPTYLSAAGWDWMPYVPGRLAGITGNVYLSITADIRLDDPWMRADLESNEYAYLEFSTDVINSSNREQEVTVKGMIKPGNIAFSKTTKIAGNSNKKVYITKNEIKEFIVKDPLLWWPNGYGNPNLYICEVEVFQENVLSDSRKIQFGIRKYEYQYSRNEVGWPVLNFFINGKKIFLKGGNWGMSEYLLRCRGEEYETKIKLHKDMNFNIIRLWTGTVTDDEFYDYCDQYGILVWDDFWLYVAYNDVVSDDDFKANALDKIKRLRNHPSIAIWCGANETHPKPELDNYLRTIVAQEDKNDRLYKSSSNQDGLSGSGWWGNQPPKHHFETSGSNLAWNSPAYPYGSSYGYGLRTEIGTATFPNYESIVKFIPQDKLWPLPTDEELKDDDSNVWNKHFFGKEASNANPIAYKTAVNKQFGESDNLKSFAEKSQYLNYEVMRGMYEAWNDKLWDDAAGLIIWMSQSAYPSFVWQTYDYYYDATGAYWGAKKACEPVHVQWNSSNNSIKAINTSHVDLDSVEVSALVFNIQGDTLHSYTQKNQIAMKYNTSKEVFRMNFNSYNLALNKPIYTSSEDHKNYAKYINDGALGSRWESKVNDFEWIYIDLESRQFIKSIAIHWEAAYASQYEVQISDDSQSWRTIKSVKNGKGELEELDLGGIYARYIKLACSKRATPFAYSIFELEVYGKQRKDLKLSDLHFIKLALKDKNKNILSENFYWRNGQHDLDYTALNNLPKAKLLFEKLATSNADSVLIKVKNIGNTVSFGNRIRVVDTHTQERILPLMISDNYFTLLPDEEKILKIEAMRPEQLENGKVLWKQYNYEEKSVLDRIL